MKYASLVAACLLFAAQTLAQPVLPVIDMHMHALGYTEQGPPPLGMCTPVTMPVWDQRAPYAEIFMRMLKEPPCDDPIWSPLSDEENLERNLAVIAANNVYGVLSGSREMVDRWMAAAPGRFLPGLAFKLNDESPTPDDLRLEPYWAALEANDIPAGIHVGTGPPGVIYLGATSYRARLHSALTVEEVLASHPSLRIYLMHAGYPMLDDLLALMYAHPQVYVDIGVIVYTLPRDAFYHYMEGIFTAGFGKRVMFGSDQMVWPEAIARSIQIVNDAPFLSDEQKRDVLFWNAARFLRLSDEEIARMHATGAAQ